MQRPRLVQGVHLESTAPGVDRGLQAGNATDRIIDYTFALGGPIKKDQLWFFTSARYFSVNNFIANTFFDDGSQGVDDQFIRSLMARLTWQASPRNKFTAYFDEVEQKREDERYFSLTPPPRGEEPPDFWYRGGVALVMDLESYELRYAVQKSIVDSSRLRRQQEFVQQSRGASLRELYFGGQSGPRLAALHADE